jgi:serine-type D-Ala-D-Ala carboxypeptidase (penicillin-binding protein 5/6)
MTKTSQFPFMTPDQSRRRRAAARRRRTRRRALAVAALALLIVAGIGVMALARTHPAKGSSAKAERAAAAHAPAHAHTVAVAQAPVRRSQEDLTLGTPPLRLTGIGDPDDAVQPSFAAQPRAGLLFNLSTGQVLWQRNPYLKVRMASLTKMMTALLTVRSKPSDAHVPITREAVDMPGSKVGVLPLGKRVRLETLMYGLLLPSGNDAAVALAHYVAGSVNAFVKRMNEEAAELGMGCTRYSSPSGYYDKGNYTCAADLAELAKVDLEQPRIASIAKTYTAALPFPIKGGRLFLYNNNPLLIYGYPGATGLKTGYTEAAGRCLVATAERHGVRLGVVLLHSPDPGTQASELLNLGFEDVYHQRPVHQPPMPADA